jgi:hypothetical protein
MKEEAHYSPAKLTMVRRHLRRVTGGLFVIREYVDWDEEPPMRDGTYIVCCSQGPDKINGGTDYVDAGVLCEDAYDRLREWGDGEVEPGKLGCIEDPERGCTYTQEACYLINDLVVEPWDG